MFFNLRPIPDIQFDPDFFPQFKLFAQSGNLAPGAREKKTRFLFKLAPDVKFFHQQMDFINGFQTKLITAICFCRADLPHQLAQGNIHFILQQAGAAAGAARPDFPLVHQDGVHACFCQMIAGQRAGDATAHHRDLANQLAVKRRISREQPVANAPKRMIGS